MLTKDAFKPGKCERKVGPKATWISLICPPDRWSWLDAATALSWCFLWLADAPGLQFGFIQPV